MRTLPAASLSSPATARSSEVLPQPEGPISTPICPLASDSETPATASWLAPSRPRPVTAARGAVSPRLAGGRA